MKNIMRHFLPQEFNLSHIDYSILDHNDFGFLWNLEFNNHDLIHLDRNYSSNSLHVLKSAKDVVLRRLIAQPLSKKWIKNERKLHKQFLKNTWRKRRSSCYYLYWSSTSKPQSWSMHVPINIFDYPNFN